jgi:hypothetical protein
MKALTICQPYAHLIALPDDDYRAKRVENRTWPTNLRGEILIHAGKNRNYLNLSGYDIPEAQMAFGAIIAVANLVDCVELDMFANGINRVPQIAHRRWPWLAAHQHTEGPFCFVLTQVRALPTPIPFKGAQGFFNVPREIEEAARQQLTAEVANR